MTFAIPEASANKNRAKLEDAKQKSNTMLASDTVATTLQAYIVVSAVKMSDDPGIKRSVNITEAFGLSDQQLQQAKVEFIRNGVTQTVVEPPAVLTNAIQQVKSTNPSTAAARFQSRTEMGSGESETSSSSSRFSKGSLFNLLSLVTTTMMAMMVAVMG